MSTPIDTSSAIFSSTRFAPTGSNFSPDPRPPLSGSFLTSPALYRPANPRCLSHRPCLAFPHPSRWSEPRRPTLRGKKGERTLFFS